MVAEEIVVFVTAIAVVRVTAVLNSSSRKSTITRSSISNSSGRAAVVSAVAVVMHL